MFKCSKNTNFDCSYIILIIGNHAVGKTSFVNSFVNNIDTFIHDITTFPDLFTQMIKYRDDVIKLYLWDTPGYENTILNYGQYRYAHGVIIMYSVTDYESFNNIEKIWIKNIIDHCELHVPVLLVGNKTDVNNKTRKITYEQGLELADKHNLKFIEISVKSNININKLFEILIDDILESNKKLQLSQSQLKYGYPIYPVEKKKHNKNSSYFSYFCSYFCS